MKLIVAVLCLAVSACSGMHAFYKQAPPGSAKVTAVQYSKKVLQHSNVIGKEIIALRKDPSVSQDSKDALLAGYRKSVCSEAERNTAVPTADCREGPQWRLDHAIGAWEGLTSAENEAEMQKASDEVVRLIADLVDLIAGVRS